MYFNHHGRLTLLCKHISLTTTNEQKVRLEPLFCYFARPDPMTSTVEQWQQINRAVTYAESQGVKVKITSVK